MKQWLSSASLYRQPRVIGILFLGFSSGLPFLLTLGTLHAWLKASDVSNTVIGYFALATIPYAFKFVWAPFTDHVKIPLLSNAVGHRRSWIFASQFGLIISLLLLGSTNPQENIFNTALATLLVSFCASFQDNSIEAYRIELLPREHLGPGASASVLGFRLGMWVSGGGALYLSYILNDWFIVYSIMALCITLGMLTTLILPEPASIHKPKPKQSSFLNNIRNNMLPAVTDFTKQPDFSRVLVFLFLFKIGDTVLNMISIPFLIEIGFNNLEIANIAKSFGICAMIAGGLFAGVMQIHRPPIFNLSISSVLLALSSLMFMMQAYLGHDVRFLILTMGVENFACGISATALISFLSSLCQQPNTATHFAILSSFCSLSRIGLSIGAGWLADKTDWISYFAIVGSLSLLPLIWLAVHGQQIVSYYRRQAVTEPNISRN